MIIKFGVSEEFKVKHLQMLARRNDLVKTFEEREVQLRQIFDTNEIRSALSLLLSLRADMAEFVSPQPYFEDAFNRASEAVDILSSILNFDPARYPSGFEGDVRALRLQINAKVAELRIALPPLMAFYAAAKSEENLREKSDEANLLIESIKSAKKEIDGLVAATKTTTAQQAVDEHVAVFEKESKEYANESKSWLWMIAVTTIVGLGVIFLYMWLFPPNEDDKISVINFIGLKLVLIALYFTMLSLGVRRFMAASHNVVINRHRASAMKSFELFVASARSEESKDAILRCAAESIFSMQRSGLLGKDQPAPNPISVNALSMPSKTT